MEGDVKVAAVVVTYNRKELLRECLNALLNQTRPLDEIIVIDNASTDGTQEMIAKEFPYITYVLMSENIGGAGGFHEGMKLAYEKGYDWIWVFVGRLADYRYYNMDQVVARALKLFEEVIYDWTVSYSK